jgi:16S rRNA (cytosine1407-C5)-methyltransferase
MDARLKNLPLPFLERLKKIIPPGQISDVTKAFLNDKPETFRINTLKANPDDVLKEFTRARVSWEKDPLISSCFYFKNISKKKITELDAYQSGKIYLQNISSQIPPLILNPKPGETVLDACASPGSKTTQMAALMGNHGILTAIEPDEIRFARLRKNVENLGATCVETVKTRAESFCRSFPEQAERFDKVLLDAPCSGDGTFYINDKASYAHWSEDFVKKTAKLQLKLLNSVIDVTKNGGLILYSTCSLSPEENESVIDAVLKTRSDVNTVSFKDQLRWPFLKSPLPSWYGVTFHPKIAQTARITPSLKHEGFFVALLKRVL